MITIDSLTRSTGGSHPGDGGVPGRDDVFARAAHLARRLLDIPVVLVLPPGGAAGPAIRCFPPEAGGSGPETDVRIREWCEGIAATAQPLWLEDVATGGAAGLDAQAAVAAFAGVPLSAGNSGAAGALCVLDRRPRAWSEEDRVALRELAELASAAAGAREQEPALEHLCEIADGFAALVEASPLAIVAVDRESRVELWSPAAERMFGWTQDEVLRRTIPIVPEADQERTRELRTRVLAGERLTGVQVPRLRKDGSMLDVSLSTATLNTRGGEVYGTIAILEDVTERRKAEERMHFLETAGRVLGGLFEYEDRLESLVRLTVPALGDLCVVDVLQDDGTVTRARAVHAVAEKRDFLQLADGPADDGPFAAVLAGDPVLAHEPDEDVLRLLARGMDPDGARRLEVRSLISVPLHARGRSLGVLTVGSEDPARRYGEVDLALARELATRASLLLDNSRLYREAQQATRAREEILAVVSHELRNPLQAISVLVDTLLQWLPPESWRERERRQLESILHVSRQMSRLVQDLLDVTRMEGGHFSVRCDREPLDRIAAESLEMLSPLAERANVRLEVSMPAGAPEILADRQRLVQVIGNLVQNAIRVTPRGGSVTLAAEAAGGEVRFRVADAGPGIAAADLPHLFKRFWRAERAGGRGAGLGLAIASGIVEAHGGRIGVDTGAGGSTFWFTVPTAGPDERGADAAAEAYDSVVLLSGGERTRSEAEERSRDDALRERAAAERHARFSEAVGSGPVPADRDADPLEHLREQIATAVHLGHIQPGDRLPSIRDVARRFRITTYAAVHAYERLATEGLVEKRGRSGMYVAALDSLPRGTLLGETALWLVDVLEGAWEHQVKVPHVPDLVRRWTAAVRLRAACVEDDADTLAGLCADTALHFGMDSSPVDPESLPRSGGADAAGRLDLPEGLRDADLLITTTYHAARVRPVAEALGKPMLVAAVNPEHARAVENRLRDRELTVVCADERFGKRVSAMRGGRYASRVRVVLAHDRAALQALDPADPVLLTRAAHERLEGVELRSLVPLSPFIGPGCARQLAELLVQLNVHARRV